MIIRGVYARKEIWTLHGKIYNPVNDCLAKKWEPPRETSFGDSQSCKPTKSAYLYIMSNNGCSTCYNNNSVKR